MLKILYNNIKDPSRDEVLYLFNKMPPKAIEEFDTMMEVHTNKKTGQQKPITHEYVRSLLDKYKVMER